MPITLQYPVTAYDQKTFHQINERVMGLAFDLHNEFGRYLKEEHCRNELLRRCTVSGLEADKEFQMIASLDSFRKPFYADLMVERGVIVETKTVSSLGDVQKGQALNYLFFCELNHGTLLNFRTERVEHQFVSTRLNHELRQQFSLVADGWQPLTPECRRLREVFETCLREWGAYLDPVLYQDALTYFSGDEDQVIREVPVRSAGITIGTQKMRLVTEDIAFAVTASTHRPDIVFDHQRRFTKHTPLRALHWFNLNHNRIELRTVTE